MSSTAHIRRVLVTDGDLARLRSHAEFNAMALDKLEWRKLADALAELERRRSEDNAKEPA